MKQFSLDAGNGRYRLEAAVSVSENGISVHLIGGEAPHIGSVVLAEPRVSLTGEGRSCTSSVLNRLGHKDEAFARDLAERLCKQAATAVCVCAGVHIEDATAEDIAWLSAAYETIAQSVCDAVGAGRDGLA